MLDGSGIYSWPDGRKYDGQYVDDKKHGHGIYYWPDGKKYEGGWKESKQHGEGVFTNNKGQNKKGLWENGDRIKWISETKQPGETHQAGTGMKPISEDNEEN